ncbi:MAG TPA: helix-hairpin-helix domain-containing protein [Caulobacteraceae bacterium]|nr:helix-hairpin-helix domain-containing protein [Caulobacteraceae bacterium]
MPRKAAPAALVLALWTVLPAHGQPTPPAPAKPADPDEAAFRQVCGRCHDTELVADTPRSYDDWEDTVQSMIERGAKGSDAQFVSVMTYLYRTLTTINVNTAEAEDIAAVLHVGPEVADAVIARRTSRKFSDLADLKTVPGLDPALLEAKSKLIFF